MPRRRRCERMASIKITASGISAFAEKTATNSSQMIEVASDLLGRVNGLYNEVVRDHEAIGGQIMRLQQALEDVLTKAASYEYQYQEAQAAADAAQAELSYELNNPTVITTTDEDGNESTQTVYNDSAISAARATRDREQAQANKLAEKLDYANNVSRNIKQTIDQFCIIRNGIYTIGEAIQNDAYQINKCASSAGEEASNNLQCLGGVIDSVSAYLSSKPISVPNSGDLKEDFS